MIDFLSDANSITAWITITLGGIALGVRKIYADWVAKTPDILGNQAKADVIEFLREEIRRLAHVNTELATQVNQFQMENIKLNAELTKVREQMHSLQHENATLGLQLIELNNAIKDFKTLFKECKDCPDFVARMNVPVDEDL